MKSLAIAGGALLPFLLLPAAAHAQAAPVAAQAAVDPVRLAEARKLIDVILPPATRDQMFAAMIAATTQNMMRGITQSPDFQAALDGKPGARDVFERFIDRQQELGLADLRANLPALLEAMARAYARRFTVDQMHDIAAFFTTATGQLYMTQAGSIMADPDVAAWQQSVMSRSMARMPDETAALRRDIEALDGKSAPHAP